jgi:hypothetical protein
MNVANAVARPIVGRLCADRFCRPVPDARRAENEAAQSHCFMSYSRRRISAALAIPFGVTTRSPKPWMTRSERACAMYLAKTGHAAADVDE